MKYKYDSIEELIKDIINEAIREVQMSVNISDKEALKLIKEGIKTIK